jgi:hypothetical protein
MQCSNLTTSDTNCHMYEWLLTGFAFGFTDHLQLVTSNCNITTNILILQITTTHGKSFQSAVSSQVVPWLMVPNGEYSSTAPTKPSLHKLPYNSDEFPNQTQLWHLGTECIEDTIRCCNLIVFMGKCLFAKALPSNGSIYLLIKNLLPSSECCFVVRFEVVTQ